MTVNDIYRVWDNFWFRETSPSPVCLFRIAYGLLVLLTALLMAQDLFLWFGPHGVISPQTVHDWENSESRFSLFFIWPESHALALTVFVVLVISSMCLTVGLFTRLSAFIVFICLVSFQQRMACIFNAGDTILRHQALFLMFSEAGALYSIDRMLRRRTASNAAEVISSPWAQRLIQVQMCGVYAQTFFSKLACPQWIDGTALYYCSRLTDFTRLPTPFLFDHLWTCQLLSWMTLVVEFSLFTLIWFPKFRYYVIAFGVVFHLTIDWSMNIPVFEYIMIATYINFLKPDTVSFFIAKIMDKCRSSFTKHS
jgi:Vitamin K-dependent gamma-carboxylase